jgi:hypothetical protein
MGILRDWRLNGRADGLRCLIVEKANNEWKGYTGIVRVKNPWSTQLWLEAGNGVSRKVGMLGTSLALWMITATNSVAAVRVGFAERDITPSREGIPPIVP